MHFPVNMYTRWKEVDHVIQALSNYGLIRGIISRILRPMNLSIKLNTINSGWLFLYIESSAVPISKKILYFVLLWSLLS